MRYLADLAGVQFRDASAKAIVKTLVQGDELELRRDNENQYDDNAVGVWWNDVHLGYVDRVTASSVGPGMDSGRMYQCQIEDPDQRKPSLSIFERE